MATEDVALRIALKDEISSGLGSIKDKLISIGTAWLSWEVGKRFIVGVFEESAKLQGQMLDLEAAVKRAGHQWSAAKPNIEAFTQRMEDQKGVIDDYTRGALQRALDFTKDLTKAEEAVSMAADIASAKHIDLESATDLLGKAYQGNVTQLQRMLPELRGVIKEGDSLGKILNALKYYEGAAGVETEKLTTQWGLFLDKLEDVNAAIGRMGGADEKGGGAWGAALRFGSFYAKELARAIDDLTVSSKLYQLQLMAMARQDGALDKLNKYLRELYPTVEVLSKKIKMLVSHETAEDVTKTLGHMAEMMKAFNSATKYSHNTLDEWVKSVRMISKDAPNAALALEALTNAMTPGEQNMDAIDKSQENSIKKREHVTTAANVRLLADWRKTHRMMSAEALAAFEIAIPAALTGGVQKMLSQWKWLNEETNGIFKKMAQDFTRYFIDAILESIAKKLATGILKALALFDVPANDRFIMQEGINAAKHFQSGFIGQMSGFGTSVAGAVAMPNQGYGYSRSGNQLFGGNQITINIHGAMTPQFIRDALAPIIEKDSLKGLNAIQVKAAFTTGRSPLALA